MASDLARLLQDYFYFGKLESEISAAAIIIAGALFAGVIVYLVFRRYLSHWAKGTKTKIDDKILKNVRAPIIFLFLLVGIHYGLQSLSFLEVYSGPISAIFLVAQILLATFIIARVLNILISWFAERAKREKRVSEHLLNVLKQVVRAIAYLFAFFAILAVFKIDLSGLVVGLGVGGIAIALALQNILVDAFGAFTIYFDRPFEVGDFIVVEDYSGTVKKIGIRSTRIQLLRGEELVLSNRLLTTASVRNFKKLKKRRVVFKFGVAVDTSAEKLKKIPTIVKEIITNIELTEFDRVHLNEFGDFSYNYEAVYYMEIPDYTTYMDVQQQIYLKIIEAFEKEKITMPFPTQTIFLNKE